MPLAAGTRLGPYEIVSPIGKGGMGEVYRARDTKLDREVAIKVLPEELSQDKQRLDRFEREARLLAQLNHANVATLHGLEEHAQPLLVMELVEGETLAERIARGPIPGDEAIRLFIQIADGLEAAHKKGIIHRDLKPANIKIDPNGNVKVLDFGLAKAYAVDARALNLSESPTATKGTAIGAILGTAPYMSPEQARGQPLDGRTDIWAFGCVLFEALTQRATFPGETVSDTIAAILEREPDWDALPAETSASLRRLMRRCLEKEPSRRLHDIADARIELTESDSPGATQTFEPLNSRVTRRVLVALLAGALIGAVFGYIRRTPESRASAAVLRTAIPLAPGASLSVVGGAPAVAISPDDKHIAYLAERDGVRRLHVRPLDQLDARIVQESEGATAPFFSPDSQWAAFVSAGKLMKISMSGSEPARITESGLSGGSWSEDGRIVLGTGINLGGGLLGVKEGTIGYEELATPDRARRERLFRSPHALPGGKAVLFTMSTADTENWDDSFISVLRTETGEYRVLLEGGTTPQYSPSGHIVFARGGNLLAIQFDVETLEVTGAPTIVVEGVVTTEDSANFSLSRTGSLVYAAGGVHGVNRRIVWVDRQGNTEPLIETPNGWLDPRLSPDGGRVALGISGANNTVWVYDIERSTLDRIANDWNSFLPSWSPDGRHVTFQSDRAGVTNPYRILADGSGAPERLAARDLLTVFRTTSPDGRYYISNERHAGTGFDIYFHSTKRDVPPQEFLVTEFREWLAELSPDGRWMAYISNETGRYEVYVRPFPPASGKWRISTSGGVDARWNPNGRELFYRAGTSLMSVSIEPVDSQLGPGRPRVLFDHPFTTLELESFDVSRDGERFLVLEDVEADPMPTHLVLVQNFGDELERLVPTSK